MSSTQCDNGACAHCHPENKQNGECYLRSPTQPSEQRECSCHCTTCDHKPFAGLPCSICKHTHTPSPEQDWRRKISSIIPQFYSGTIGIVEFESFVDKIKSIVAAEKAKSYEAGQRETVSKVQKELDRLLKEEKQKYIETNGYFGAIYEVNMFCVSLLIY